MYVIIAPIQIKEGSKDEFLAALLPNAQGAANTEPGCLRFDVIQDAGDPNRVWVYEVYTDEAAFRAHGQSEHYLKAIEVLGPLRDEAGTMQGAARGSSNVWPTDAEWK
jgi:quinol monooxygenase YgiN